MANSSERRHRCIVPGLDVLIGGPEIFSPRHHAPRKAEVICIPKMYLRRLGDFYDELSTRGEASKEIFHDIDSLLTRCQPDQHNTIRCRLANGTILELHDTGYVSDTDQRHPSSKEHAIGLTRHLQSEGRDVALMTGSDKLATFAALEGLDVAHVNPHVYKGYVKVPLYSEEEDFDLTTAWYSRNAITLTEWREAFANHPELWDLKVNQYVEFDLGVTETGSHPPVGRFDGVRIAPLKRRTLEHPAYRPIRPKTHSQLMIYDALLAPPEEIPIVVISGVFGTGKTFATLACGLDQVESGIYERIFVCPRDAALGEEIGFLPGDEEEKTRAKARPIEDNLRAILRLRKTDKKPGPQAQDKKDPTGLDLSVENYIERYFEFTPLINMGGRSIAHSFIILDEFQDTERHQAKALLSRIGDGSKIVVMGDPTQITNSHLNRTSNGLSYAASKLAGSPLAAVITIDDPSEIVRSPAAQAIADLLA